MHKNTKWLLVGVALLISVFAIGAVACGDDDDDEDDAPAATEAPADDDDDMVLELVANLTEMDGSGASGEAKISPNGDGILVSLGMAGLTEGAHANHLHHGSCADLGEIHIFLDDVVADENGDGTQTTADDEQPIDHFVAGHYLAVHAEDSETIGVVVSCGDVVAP